MYPQDGGIGPESLYLSLFFSKGMIICMAWCRMYAKKSKMYIRSSISLDNIFLTVINARIMTIKNGKGKRDPR